MVTRRLPIMLLIGFAQIASCDMTANTKLVEFCFLHTQINFDVAQASSERQLRKSYA